MTDFINWTKLAAEVDGIISQFLPVTITRQTVGAYNTATGAAAVTTSVQTGSGAVSNYELKDIDGTLVKQGDKKLLLSAVGITAPVVDDTVTANSVVYTITKIRPISPAATAVLYICNIRGAS
jgi:hypothetical protein